MILYIDIDDTIAPMPDSSHRGYEGLPFGEPFPEMVERIRNLSAEGHYVVIWSCRTNPQVMGSSKTETELVALVASWLGKHQIPFDEIGLNKPFFTQIIDDRALNPHSLKDMLALENSRLVRYVSHDSDCCAKGVCEAWEEDPACTCGLSGLLHERHRRAQRGSVRGGRIDA